MREAKVVRFFNNGNNAPAYSCDTPGSQSGFYVKADDYEHLYTKLMNALGRIDRQRERIRCLEGATNHAGGTPLSRAEEEIKRLKEENGELAHSFHSTRDQLVYERELKKEMKARFHDDLMEMKVCHSDSITALQQMYKWKLGKLKAKNQGGEHE